MAVSPLKPPGLNFAEIPLDIEMVSPSLLHRVSDYTTREPFFGRTNSKRFDDPGRVASKRFGTCYLGLSLTVAFSESVLHDLEPDQGAFRLPETEITRRYAWSFQGPDLRLANLTGTSLLLLGGHAELCGTTNYALTKKWARAVANHPDNVDGFLYMSRRVNDSLAVVPFERNAASHPNITPATYWKLDEHPDFPATMKKLNVKPVT